MAQRPDTHILHRQMAHTLPVAASAQGVYITDSQGRQYIDASGGAAVSCLGHGHPEVLAAMHAQLDRLAYAHTSFFTTEVAEELADLLVQGAPAGTSHAYFVTGGSEAVEAALKMARQYFVEIGQPQRRHFIARRQSYHGNTLGALAVGGNAWRRKQFAPLLIEVHHVSPCYEYRDRRADESADAVRRAAGAGAGEAIERWAPRPSSPSSPRRSAARRPGALTPVEGYFKRVREMCDRHGILLILDEVMCGMGRTGTLHACEAGRHRARPDGDRQGPGRRLRADRRRAGAGARSSRPSRRAAALFQHGHTYLGHPAGLRGGAGRAAGDPARQPARAMCSARATACASGCMRPSATTITSATCAAAGCSRPSSWWPTARPRRPFDPAHKLHARIKQQAMARGLMVYPMGGTLDGQHGDHVLLAPPFIVDDAQSTTSSSAWRAPSTRRWHPCRAEDTRGTRRAAGLPHVDPAASSTRSRQ